MSSDESVPLLRDVTFRITEQGDFIGLDMDCGDGAQRTIAIPAVLVSKFAAGFLWAAEESGRRGAVAALSDAVLGHLQASAPVVTAFDVAGSAGGPVLDFQVGAAHVCLRFTRDGAKALLASLARFFDPAPHA